METKKARRISEYPDRRLSLGKLLTEGIPHTKFTVGYSQSKHSSGHLDIEKIEIGNLEIVKTEVAEAMEEIDSFNRHTSQFLKTINNFGKRYDCTGEKELHTLVGYLLQDILEIMGLTKSISMAKEAFVSRAKYLKSTSSGNKSELWLIYDQLTRPIMVWAVKSPRAHPDILDLPDVQVQIADYILDIASFYGQRDIIGITTSGNHFKFHWLPHSNPVAQSDHVDDNRGVILDCPMPELKRELICTQTFKHDDPGLVHRLMSAVKKCYYSPYYAVDLISQNRTYITLSEDSWCWARLTEKVSLDNLTLRVDSHTSRSSTFVVLNHLVRNAEQLVWVALAGNTSRIVVLKQFPDDCAKEAETELKIWQEVNSQQYARLLRVRELTTLLMPLVLQVKREEQEEEEDDDDNFKYFLDCDLYHYLFACPTAVPGRDITIPERIASLRNQLMEKASEYAADLRRLATEAIESLATHRWVHGDLEWRHFGLLPFFSADGDTVVRLLPCMIDFSRATKVEAETEAEAVEIARKLMMESLATLK